MSSWRNHDVINFWSCLNQHFLANIEQVLNRGLIEVSRAIQEPIRDQLVLQIVWQYAEARSFCDTFIDQLFFENTLAYPCGQTFSTQHLTRHYQTLPECSTSSIVASELRLKEHCLV